VRRGAVKCSARSARADDIRPYGSAPGRRGIAVRTKQVRGGCDLRQKKLAPRRSRANARRLCFRSFLLPFQIEPALLGFDLVLRGNAIYMKTKMFVALGMWSACGKRRAQAARPTASE